MFRLLFALLRVLGLALVLRGVAAALLAAGAAAAVIVFVRVGDVRSDNLACRPCERRRV